MPNPSAARTARLGGVLAVIGGLTGVLAVAVVLLVPPVVPAARFSYPFDATGHTIAQAAFFLHHLVVAIALVAFWRAGLAGRGRFAAVASILAAATMTVLGLVELFAITAAQADAVSPEADAVTSIFGAASLAVGAGLVLIGIAAARARVLAGFGRWILLATGIYVFVVLTPAVFGPFLIGRLAIGIWLLLFALAGVAMLRWSRILPAA